MGNNNYNILFIGRFFPKNILSTIINDTKGLVEFSNHNFEISLIDGLSKQSGINLKIFSIPGVYPYPLHNKKLFQSAESYQTKGKQVQSIPMFNLIGVNRVATICSSVFYLLRVLRSFKGEKVHLIVNIPTLETLLPIEIVVKICHIQLTKTLIVPDVPTVMDTMSNRKGSVVNIRRILSTWTMYIAQHYNRYVFLTDKMKDFFPACVDTSKYIVVEGLINKDSIRTLENDGRLNSHKEIILYAGSLKRVFGIENLIKAFEIIKSNDVELWICGSGDYQDEIRKMALVDNRIRFIGLVCSEEAKALQAQASILVNPRTNEGLYTKYSFPSKTIEYLLSGKSVIMNRLSGVPHEYYQYVYVPQDETVYSLAKMIEYVISEPKETRKQKSLLGREFVINKKNSVYQTKRIIELISLIK